MDELVTIGDLKRITGLPAHVINHALDRHGPPPAGRMGLMRVWRRADLPRIEESIRRTTQHRREAEQHDR